MTSMSELPHRRNISFSLGSLMACLVVVAAAAFIAGAIHPQAVTISPITICSTETQPVTEETPYLAENDATMGRMMSAMAIKPSGDVDRDFVAMMSPHHQGAIEMAQRSTAQRKERTNPAARAGNHRHQSRKSPPCGWRSASRCRIPRRLPTQRRPRPSNGTTPACDPVTHSSGTRSINMTVLEIGSSFETMPASLQSAHGQGRRLVRLIRS